MLPDTDKEISTVNQRAVLIIFFGFRIKINL